MAGERANSVFSFGTACAESVSEEQLAGRNVMFRACAGSTCTVL